MSMDGIRRVGRIVTNRNHVLTEQDSISVPIALPDGRCVNAPKSACDVPGAVGVPASVFIDAGLPVHEDWLIEVRGGRVVHLVGRVFGAHSLWPQERSVA